jgi:hypothetical protein
MCRFTDSVAAIVVITTGAEEYAVRTGCFPTAVDGRLEYDSSHRDLSIRSRV